MLKERHQKMRERVEEGDFLRSMERYSQRLDRKNEVMVGEGIFDFAKKLEKKRLGSAYFKIMNEAMMEMVEWQKQEKDTKPIVGAVFRTGVNDGIGMCALLPTTPDSNLTKDISLDEIVHGTPVLIQFRDATLAGKWDSLSQVQRVEEAQKILIEKRERVLEKKAKMNINWGGWGSLPWYLMKRQQLTQQFEVEEEGLNYELSVSMGLLGSAFTLNREQLRKKPELMKQLKLKMFVSQLEDALTQVGRLMDPETDPGKMMGELAPDLIGHSMGGYLAIIAATAQDLPTITAIRNSEKSRIIADKPVIVGAKVKVGIPAWMDKIMESPYYKNQVLLQDGVRGMMVRMGAKMWWEKSNLIKSVREIAGPYLPPIRRLFKDFLSPKVMWDGADVYDAHLNNYFWDLEYHALCVELLDTAEPVVGTDTTTRERSKLSFLKILMGAKDKVLRHDLTMVMANELLIEEKNCYWKTQCAHHMTIDEIIWAMGLRNNGKSN